MNPFELNQLQDRLNRRLFLHGGAQAVGTAALASLMSREVNATDAEANSIKAFGLPGFPNHVPKAKRIIYLFQSGAPSQMDLFDPKPLMKDRKGEDLPGSIRMGQRLTTMTSGQKTFPVAPSIFEFKQHGDCGMWMSELLPHMSTIADKFCMVRSMVTEAINHDPAITFCQTGSQLAGRPSIGSWVSYGLGSENLDLPAYVVLTSFGSGRKDDQPLYDRLWSAGFLSSKHQGIKFRNQGDAVLYLSNPPGVNSDTRRSTLDRLAALNGEHYKQTGDPEIQSRIAQYEMAFRMQSSVPDLLDLASEPQHILDMYGPDVKRPGSYAANCLLARRLAERDVRFVQVWSGPGGPANNWDNHTNIAAELPPIARQVDQPIAALLKDLKASGMLADTLVIWTTEFGRMPFTQGGVGRDHNGGTFVTWLAGAGIKPGITFGESDDFSYQAAKNKTACYDLHATLLHLMGVDHEKLTVRQNGIDRRLTDVHGKVIREILS